MAAPHQKKFSIKSQTRNTQRNVPPPDMMFEEVKTSTANQTERMTKQQNEQSASFKSYVENQIDDSSFL